MSNAHANVLEIKKFAKLFEMMKLIKIPKAKKGIAREKDSENLSPLFRDVF